MLISLLLATKLCVAQKSDRDKIYWTALEQYVISIESESSDTTDSYSYRSGNKIYLEKPFYIDSIPPQIGRHKIILITRDTQRVLYEDHNNKLIHTRISPLTIKDEKLFITITPYHGTFKKKQYFLGASDGVTIYFKFDCNKKKYVFDRIENWAI